VHVTTYQVTFHVTSIEREGAFLFRPDVRRPFPCPQMERPSYVAAQSIPSLRQQMVEVVRDRVDIGHTADVLIERYPSFLASL
jgi:hypothetical protein